jgi:hypothetical protein
VGVVVHVGVGCWLCWEGWEGWEGWVDGWSWRERHGHTRTNTD